MTLMQHSSTVAWSLALLLAGASSASAQVWEVWNDFEETFYISLRSASNRATHRFSDEIALPPDGPRSIQLRDPDPYDIRLRTQGGQRIRLSRPVSLKDRDQTSLSEIVSPAGRRDGRTVYNAMQQDGFFSNNKYDRLIDDLLRATWDSTYQAFNNSNMRARIVFNGIRGTYQTSSFQGQFQNVTYTADETEGKVFVEGTWRGVGRRGPFVFTLEESAPNRFTGKYAAEGQDRWLPWTGTRR